MNPENRAVRCITHSSFSFLICLLACTLCTAEIIRYTSDTLCDRHSLDAVYNEKYKLITNNIFADMKEFVSRVTDLVADSLAKIMAELPYRDVSDKEERKIHLQFKNVKSTFTVKAKKIQRNITSCWDDLIASNFDLMFDNGKSSLEDYVNKTVRMTDSYADARKTLDSTLSTFIDFIKSTIRDGLSGIKMASENAINMEEEEKKKNETETEAETEAEAEIAASTEDSSQNNKSQEEILRDKTIEIANLIVPGFLGKVTVEVINRNMDLTKSSGIKPENRDSVLDDMNFDMIMIKNRIRAIIQTDVPKDKGATDLSRRNVYTYWADMADEMYKEKIRSAKSTDKSSSGRLYYRNLWKDEVQLMETLLDLMEMYP